MSSFDWDEGYAFDDPKHSSYSERFAELADLRRKALKENPTDQEEE